ncbi:MAG: FAD-binding oxidoreductase [Nonlabens sp.]
MHHAIAAFKKILPASRVLTGADLADRYSHIWKMDEPLTALCHLSPETTEQLSAVLKICNEHELTVVTHGGLTNLVGSTTSTQNDVVISLERMDSILEINNETRTATVEAGVILEILQDAVKDKGMLFPLNFGAKGSAHIGGIISTNAGGLRVLKYGMTRNLVLGLEYVLIDGTVVSSLKTIIKDNSGYDLKQLIIGSEGTLGIITKAVFKLEELPTSRQAAMVGVNEYKNVMRLLKYMDASLSGKLSGYELMWSNAYEQLTSNGAQARPPVPYGFKFYVLIEMQGANDPNNHKDLEAALEKMLIDEIIEDAAIASSPSEVEHFFKIREDVNNITDFMKHDQHFDISIPVPAIDKYISKSYESLKLVAGVEQIYAFGHVADGNIHLMIGKGNTSSELKKEIDHVVYGGIKELNGSVSAEHGIGVDKKEYLSLSKTDEEIHLMRIIKKSLDPKNLLNRGKIFDL